VKDALSSSPSSVPYTDGMLCTDGIDVHVCRQDGADHIFLQQTTCTLVRSPILTARRVVRVPKIFLRQPHQSVSCNGRRSRREAPCSVFVGYQRQSGGWCLGHVNSTIELTIWGMRQRSGELRYAQLGFFLAIHEKTTNESTCTAA